MARSHQKTNTLGEQVAQLAAQVQQLRAELEDARGGGNGSNGHEAEPRSRRDLLRMAGVAAVGAAGALVGLGVPAQAIAGQPVLMGTTNDSNATTTLIPTPGSAPAPLVQVLGQGVTPPTTVTAVNGTDKIPLIGAIGAGGNLPPHGDPGGAGYSRFAANPGACGNATSPTATRGRQ